MSSVIWTGARWRSWTGGGDVVDGSGSGRPAAQPTAAKSHAPTAAAASGARARLTIAATGRGHSQVMELMDPGMPLAPLGGLSAKTSATRMITLSVRPP